MIRHSDDPHAKPQSARGCHRNCRMRSCGPLGERWRSYSVGRTFSLWGSGLGWAPSLAWVQKQGSLGMVLSQKWSACVPRFASSPSYPNPGSKKPDLPGDSRVLPLLLHLPMCVRVTIGQYRCVCVYICINRIYIYIHMCVCVYTYKYIQVYICLSNSINKQVNMNRKSTYMSVCINFCFYNLQKVHVLCIKFSREA